MQFISLSSWDTENSIRQFEENGILESPNEFSESEHRTYNKLKKIRLLQDTKDKLNKLNGDLNMSKGPRIESFEDVNSVKPEEFGTQENWIKHND